MGCTELLPVAEQLFEQIGFPKHPPIVQGIAGCLWARAVTGKSVPATQSSTCTRMMYALSLFFKASVSVSDKRVAAGLEPLVLLLDNVQDLIQSDRLAAGGGRQVFDALCSEILKATGTLEQNKLRVLLFGSSVQLLLALDSSELFVTSAHVPDPSEDLIRSQLTLFGYPDSEVHQIIETLGCRLRLLSPFFVPRRALTTSVYAMLATDEKLMESALRFCFLDMDTRDRTGASLRAVVAALDGLGKLGVHGEACAGRADSEPKILLSSIPRSCQSSPSLSGVFFIDVDRQLCFQNRIIRRLWEAKRAQLLKHTSSSSC